MPSSRRPTQERVRQQRAYLQCAQRGADPQAYVGLGQGFHDTSVCDMRLSDCAQDIVAITAERDTATRDLVIGNIFQDRRQQGHQEQHTTGANSHR